MGARLVQTISVGTRLQWAEDVVRATLEAHPQAMTRTIASADVPAYLSASTWREAVQHATSRAGVAGITRDGVRLRADRIDGMVQGFYNSAGHDALWGEAILRVAVPSEHPLVVDSFAGLNAKIAEIAPHIDMRSELASAKIAAREALVAAGYDSVMVTHWDTQPTWLIGLVPERVRVVVP